MKIIKLEAENIKKIRAIEIEPDSNLMQITGANAQGKTSVLDAIWYALGGKEVIGSKPIREGESEARIKLELDDFIVTRIFKQNDDNVKTSLFVESKDGAKYSSPQAVLDGLVGKLSFDPLAFSNMKAKEQFNLLCDLCEIEYSFDEAAEIKKEIYAERTVLNRQAKEVEAHAKNIIIDPEVQTEKVNIQVLIDSIEDARKFNALQAQHKHDIFCLKNDSERRLLEVKKIEDEISANTDRIKELKQLIEPTPADAEALEEKLATAEQINANAEKFEHKQQVLADMVYTRNKAGKCTRKLTELDQHKIAALKAAKMPLDNLSIDDDQVFYNNVPFDQLSGAEKLKISLAIAASTNPKLKVIRIADGSLLDTKSMDELLAFADSKDYQIWIERVDESGDIGVYIEDGMVKNNP